MSTATEAPARRRRALGYWGLGLVALVMTASLLATLVRLIDDQRHLRRENPEDIIWIAARVELEARRVIEQLTRYGHAEEGVTHDDVLTAFDVFWSRVDSLRIDNDLGIRFRAFEGGDAALELATRTLAEREPQLLSLRRGDVSKMLSIRAAFERVDRHLYQALIDGVLAKARELESVRHERVASFSTAIVQLAGAFVFGSVLVVLSIRRQDELNRLSASLERRVEARTQQLNTEVAAHRKAERERSRLFVAIEQSPVATALLDRRGRLTYANVRFLEQHHVSRSLEDGIAMNDLAIPELTGGTRSNAWQLVADGSTWEHEYAIAAEHGEAWNRAKLSPIHSEDGEREHFLLMVEDISERKEKELLLVERATLDQVTGLPNRAMGMDQLERMLANAQRAETRVAVLFVDLDRFKQVNDTFGHLNGDVLLREVGERLSQIVRRSDCVIRIGGDEFLVLLTESDGMPSARRVARAIIETCTRPYDVNGSKALIGASIGIALYPDDGMTSEDLIRSADAALYAIKDGRRGGFRFFDRELDNDVRERAHIERELDKALRDNELRLVYQPKFDVASERLIGFEALLRWHSNELGNVAPGQFISVAEETGLIVRIGQWVLNEACRFAATWHRMGHDDLYVAVNVSARQVAEEAFVQSVERTLASSGLPACSLEIEITESIMMTPDSSGVARLRTLRETGVQIAIDDFGTGYSSLRYLQNLPATALKIDRSFIGQLPGSRSHAAMVQAILGMADTFDLTVTAEGIETLEQLEWLRERDCQVAQGFLLGRPLESESVLSLLAEREPSAPARASAG